MRRSILGFVVVAGIFAGQLAAQSVPQRTEAAVGVAQTVDRTQAAASATSETVGSLQADADLGEQRVSDTQRGAIGLYALGETGLFYTSNANLTPNGGSGDMYFFARGLGGVRPYLGHGIYLDGFVSQEVFEYARFSSLDFLKFSTGGGIDYVIAPLGGLTASVRYKYERYLDTGSLDEFYVNNAIEVQLAKEFQLSDIHAVQAGWKGSWSVYAEPSLVQRDEYTFWLGWRWRVAGPLELQVFDFFSMYYYPHMGSRFDVTNFSGAALNVIITPWASVSASAGFSVNGSTQSIYNYTAASAGGALRLTWMF